MKIKKPQKPTNLSLDHLQWLVKSRNENQQCALQLYELLTSRSKEVTEGKYQNFAQDLVGISFSLWRAAFLADKTGKGGLPLTAAKSFLRTVIVDNAINYAHDKQEREWTFNYYMSNVRRTICDLNQHEKYAHLVPEWEYADRSPRERWAYGQSLLCKIVATFGRELQSITP